MTKFKDLGLDDGLIEVLSSLGHTAPTPVQVRGIPPVLKGKDLIGIAQTGTGKTGAYLLPLIQKLKSRQTKGIGALVLVPTRELASQIEKSFEAYAAGTELKGLAVFGGVDQDPQVAALRSGVEVLIATPGRLIDLCEQKKIRLSETDLFVLDEADQMLAMGFIDDIHTILKFLPEKKQTLLFSATMPAQVRSLANEILSNPELIEVTPAKVTPAIQQRVIFCRTEDKFQLLRKILKGTERELTVVFTKTRESADRVREYLVHHRMAAALIHGERTQGERERALELFKTGSMKILIATDIAARGLHIDGIDLVINFELPLEAENYVHRIGRTGRAGKSGSAVSFCDDSEVLMLEKIQKLVLEKFPSEKFKGSSEAKGKWSQKVRKDKVTAPTPGVSQEKRGFIDHSKRQKVAAGEPSKAKSHPGFRNKKKK